MNIDIGIVILTVIAVFIVEIPIVVFLTPRLVVWWIRKNAGRIMEDMLSDEKVKEILNDASRRLIGHMVGGLGGRPMSFKTIIAQIASQIAMQYVSKAGIIPKQVAEGTTQAVTEAMKEVK
jgi:uncharacterized Tic20 family protein